MERRPLLTKGGGVIIDAAVAMTPTTKKTTRIPIEILDPADRRCCAAVDVFRNCKSC